MKNCFVVMPFKPELHYMYLFMKQHIENTFNDVTCERGDSKILTVPILQKIAEYIKQADVLIADCSGRNPNVFYELGMAHALDKPVILLTADEIAAAPTDIRSFEFIRYQLDDEKGFLDKLDKALRQALGNQFDAIYQKATRLFDEFRAGKHLNVPMASKEEFTAAASVKTRTNPMPKLEDEKALAKFSLPLMVQGVADLDVMMEMGKWIGEKFA